MAVPIEILDPSFDVDSATDVVALNVAPMRIGTDWEPGDLRIVWLWINYGTTNSAEYTLGSTPAGWTILNNLAPTGTFPFLFRVVVFSKVLAVGDTDTSITFGGTSQTRTFDSVGFTLRNTQITVSPTVTSQGVAATTSSLVAPSIATGTGLLANIYMDVLRQNPVKAVVTAQAGQVTWAQAGIDNPPNPNVVPARLHAMISYEARTGGTSGTRTATQSGPPPGYYTVSSIFIPQAPDVIGTIGKAAATDTARTPTIALQNLTTGQIGKALETSTARQVFTGFSGYRTSPVFALPTAPVSASLIVWQETHFSAGSSVVVETTVDGGQSWQVCTNGSPIPRLPVGSSVIRAVRYRITVTRALLSDPSPRVRSIEMRVASDDSRDELVPLGLFLINDTVIVETSDTTSGGVTVELSGVDLSRLVSRNAWDDVYIIKGGIDYADAIKLILDNRLPGLTYHFTATGVLTPRLLFGHQLGGDPWQDAQDLATAIGYELYFDAFGVCTLRQVPDPKVNNSVWEFTDQANPTVTAVTRTISDASTFNKVIVMGESAGGTAPPASAFAVDDDPASPTYYLGPYGTVTTVFISAMVTSDTQAQAAADALLRLVRGATENAVIDAVPNPALEPGDIVTVTVAGVKLTGRFLVNTITTNLAPDQTQTLTCYRQ